MPAMRPHRTLVLLLTILSCMMAAHGQSFSVRGVSAASFPTMSATIRAVDQSGRRVDLRSTDVRILEDGVAASNVTVTCPVQPVVEPVSVVFGVDISSSMNGENAMSTARNVVLDMLSMLVIPPSEAGIVSCNTEPVIVRDVTKRRAELEAAARALDISGGTDLRAMFETPQTGVLDVVRTRGNKRVVVIITDGMFSKFPDGFYADILSRCLADGIAVIGIKVTSGTTDTSGVEASLRDLATATDGIYINDVTSPDAARAAAIAAVGTMLRSDACTVTWTARPVCSERTKRTIRFEVNGYPDAVELLEEVRTTRTASLRAAPASAAIKASTGMSTTVRVTAASEPISITSAASADPRFSITPIPFTLGPGESRDLTITYANDGAGFAYTVVNLIGTPCGGSIPVTWFGGAGAASVRVIEPNGGEELLAGAPATLRFAASDTTLPLALDVSYDAGATWDTLATTARATAWTWDRVAPVQSTTCLLRVRQAANIAPISADSLVTFQIDPTALAMHPVSGFNIIGTTDGGVVRFHRADQTYVGVWPDHRDTVTAVDAAAERIASAGIDSTIVVRDAWHRDSAIARWNVGATVRALTFDDSADTLLYSGDDAGRIAAWDARTGLMLATLSQQPSAIMDLDVDSARRALIFGTANGTVGAIDLNTRQQRWSVRAILQPIAALSAAGAVYAAHRTGEILRLDPLTGASTTLTSHPDGVQDIAVLGPTDTLMLVATGIDSLIEYDVRTMRATQHATGPFGIRRVTFGRSSVDLAVAAGPGSVWDSPTGFPTLLMFRMGVFLLSTFEDVLPIAATNEIMVVSSYGLVTIHGVDGRVRDRFLLPPGIGMLTSYVGVSPSGRYIGTVRNGRPYVMDRTDLTNYQEFFNFSIKGMLFDPGNEHVVNLIESGSVRSFDMRTRTYVGNVVSTGVDPFRLATNARNTVAALLDGYTVTLLDPLNLSAPLRQFKIDSTEFPQGLRVNDLGTLLCVTYRNRIIIYGLPTGDELGRTAPSLTQYVDAAFTPDAAQVVATGATAVGPETCWFDVPAMTRTGRTSGPFRPFSGLGDVNGIGDQSSVAVLSDVGAITIRRLARDGANDINDRSDALWSIMAPRVTLRSVDVGRVHVGSQRDSMVERAITVSSPFPVTVNGTTLIGTDAASFAVRMPTVPATASATGPLAIEVSFQPVRAGAHSCRCIVHTSSGDDTLDITGTGVAPSLQLNTTLIDLGAHFVGTSFDSTVAIVRNVTTSPVNITQVSMVGPDKRQFTMSPVAPLTLTPNAELRIPVRFAPTSIGRANTIIRISTDDGLDPLETLCFATGLGPSISIRSDSGYPGDRRPITLIMNGTAGQLQGNGALQFRASVQYDPTIIVPNGAETVDMLGGLGAATFTGTWNGMDSIVGSVPATIVLGRTDRSSVSLASFTWLDDQGAPMDLDVELGAGTYRVLGICRDGAGRFFDPDAAHRTSVIAVRYYDLLGREIVGPTTGMLLRVEVLDNGRCRTTSLMQGESNPVVD